MKKEDFSQRTWDGMKEEARKVLIKKAKARALITYGDLAAGITGASFDFEDPSHRDLIGELLGEIGSEEADNGRGLLSALVVHKEGDMEPGKGFIGLAGSYGYNTTDKTACWVQAVKDVHTSTGDLNAKDYYDFFDLTRGFHPLVDGTPIRRDLNASI